MNSNIKFSPEQLVSTTQILRNFSHNFEKASKQPLFIQRNQEIEWVLLSLTEYERLINERKKK